MLPTAISPGPGASGWPGSRGGDAGRGRGALDPRESGSDTPRRRRGPPRSPDPRSDRAGEEAGQRFARVPSDLESSPSLDRRLDWLRGRAALLVAAGDLDSARRDLSLARDLAHGAERLVIELEVRLELAHAADESATACEEIAAISGEAEGRGLVTLVDLARTARGRAPVVPSS
ncbi:MAG: hypothetical protein R2862_04305 [Thermoanaerobaculia bacterium]